MRLAAAALLAYAVASPALAACNAPLGKSVASKVTEHFAALVHFTKAVCVNTAEPAGCTIFCFSDLNISGDNRNLALTVITGSAGKQMREAGLKNFSRVVFADRQLLSERRALAIPATQASSLQASFSEGERPLVAAARVGASYSLQDFTRQ